MSSCMEIVLTLKGMLVLSFVFDTLYLDSGVMQFVFSSEEIGSPGKSFQRLSRHNMASHGVLSWSNGPNMQAVYVQVISFIALVEVLS